MISMNGALWHHHAYRIISVATSSNFTSLGPISGLGPGLGREKSGLGRAKLKMPVYRAWAPIFACQAPGLVEIQIINCYYYYQNFANTLNMTNLIKKMKIYKNII